MATAVIDPQNTGLDSTAPSHSRSVRGSVNVPIAKFPTSSSGDSIDANKAAEEVIANFNKAVEAADYDGLSQQFSELGFWRDHLTLTWSFRNVQGPKGVLDLATTAAGSRDGFRLKNLTIDNSTAIRAPTATNLDADGKVRGVQIFVKITTAIGGGTGVMRIVEEGGQWKVFTLYTTLEELKGFEEATFGRRPAGVQHGGMKGRKNWLERRNESGQFGGDKQPAVLIVGAGQAGLTIGARLKMLGVDALIVDKNDRVGDNWRKRYHQLVLHDPVWYDHMPYIPFPPHWPIFTPKDKLGGFFEAYAQLLELNVWMKTEIVHTHWDEKKKEWTVVVHRKDENGQSQVEALKPRHVIQATGHSGKKNQPSFKGEEDFKGHLLCHSSEFPGAREGVEGKKAIVVGCCNSGHDIAQDFVEKGYDVTIVQRSSTHVVSSKGITDIGIKGFYEEGGPPVEDGDLLVHGYPLPVLKALQLKVVELQAEMDKDILAGLEKAGFKLDSGPDNAGFFFKYFQRGGGYYLDVGASQLIIDGKIKVKQGQEIAEVTPTGLKFADGSELEGDEIVLATGYQNMRTQTRIMFGDEVADQVKDVWGCNEEGEFRTLWQKSGHPGFWFHGGNIALCRYFSKALSLQIKALEEGLIGYGET